MRVPLNIISAVADQPLLSSASQREEDTQRRTGITRSQRTLDHHSAFAASLLVERLILDERAEHERKTFGTSVTPAYATSATACSRHPRFWRPTSKASRCQLGTLTTMVFTRTIH